MVFQWKVDTNFGGGVGLVLESMLSAEHFPKDGGWINQPPRGLWWLRNFSGHIYCGVEDDARRADREEVSSR